jgi:fatty-acid desaturase
MAAQSKLKVGENQHNYTQFSKRLATWCMVFWAIYRLGSLAVAVLRPDVSNALTIMNNGVDDVAMTIVVSYCVNSLGEKVAYKYFESKAAERSGMYDVLKPKDDDDKEEDNGNG